jgi:hypothetical protein
MKHVIKDIYICHICDLYSSDLKADPAIYGKEYQNVYAQRRDTELGNAITEGRYKLVSKYIKSGKILDFGCATGDFIDRCNLSSNYEIQGYDINPYSSYCNITNLFDSWEALTSWDSIEHMDRPDKLITGLNAKYVFLCTPTTEGIENTIDKNILNWRHYRPHEHIHYFNANSLKRLLRVCGYDTLEITYEESNLRKFMSNKNIISIVGKKIYHNAN